MMHLARLALCVSCLAFPTTAVWAEQWIALASKGVDGQPVKLASSSISEVSLDVTLPGLTASETITKDGPYILLTIPGHGYNTELGHPKVPIISRWVEIPQGATIDPVLEVLASENISLKAKGIDKKMMPVQLPVPKLPDAEKNIPFRMDKKIYSSDNYYSPTIISVSEPIQMRGQRAVLVSFCPVSYNPVRDEISIITKAKIRLKLNGSDIAKTQKMKAKYRSLVYDNILGSILINYGAYDLKDNPLPPPPINQVIIVGDDYYNALAPLVNWDIRKGYRTIVIKTSDIPGGADTSHIRQYIKDQYDGENPPDFVLLVGDVAAIPAYITSSADHPCSDLYYSTTAGADYLPDLYISRISVADTIQLKNYIAKYLGYQQGRWSADRAWMSRAYFMASNDGGYHTLAEATNNYCLSRVRAHGMDGDSLYYYYNSGTPVAEAFGSGRAIAAYSGHGAVTYWDGPPFYQSNINALANIERYPLVASFACLTGQFTAPECFGETWIRAADKGAVAFWGSSVYSYWDEDDILQRRMFDAFLDSGYTWIGGMTLKAKLDYYQTWGNLAMTRRYFEMYNLLGSSAADLYTSQPADLTVSHPVAITLGPTTVAMEALAGSAPVAGALVGLVLKSTGKVLASGYTDPTGRAALDIETSQVGDSVYVTVTAHNCRPYQGAIGVSVSGPFVMYYGHRLDDSAGNGDGTANPGEALVMPLTVRNSGSTISIGTVKGVLSSASPLAVVTDSFHNYGIIYPGDTAVHSAGYRILLSGSCGDGDIVPFTLKCRDTEDSWTSKFSLMVRAPRLGYATHLIADPAPANGNGFPEPGEACSLAVSLANSGGLAADSAKVALSTPDPYLFFSGGPLRFGTIAAGQSAWPEEPALLTVGIPPQTPHYAWIYLDLNMNGRPSGRDSFLLVLGSPGLNDDMEDSARTAEYQAEDLWHLNQYTCHSPVTSWRCGVGDADNYLNNMNASLTTPEFVLGAANTVSFWHKYAMENTYDFGFVEYTTDGGKSWQELASYTGFLPSWTQASFDLLDLNPGTPARLRFRFTSDYSVTYAGWHLDDIQVAAWVKSPVEGDRPAGGGASAMLYPCYPQPIRDQSWVSYQLASRAWVSLGVYNILGQMVRQLEDGIREPGRHRISWDGRGQDGRRLAAGVYFVRLAAEGRSLVQKAVLVR